MKSFKLFVEMEYHELKGTKDNWAPYHVRHSEEAGRKTFSVLHQGHHVGWAHLSLAGDSVTDLHIREDHRRRGVATALYKHIEAHIGKHLKRSTHQTYLGNAFWKSRERK
jgi:GNAT superfamily N-acetyltransferase